MAGTFGQFVAIMRERRNLTQAEVAQAIGVNSPDFISLIEHGYRNLGLDRVPRLADVLRVDVHELCVLALQEQYPVIAEVITTTPKVKRTTEADELVRMVRSLNTSARDAVKSLVQQLYNQGRSVRLKSVAA